MAGTVSRGEIQEAYQEYKINRANDVGYFNTRNTEPAMASLHQFIKDEEDAEVLTLLELLLNEVWEESNISSESHSAEALLDLDEKLRQILLEEGILLELTPDRETVEELGVALDKYENGGGRSRNRRSYQSRPSRDWNFQFEWQAHGAVIDSDQALRKLGRQERWEDVLDPYDEAWEAYQNPPVSYVVAEKLYNALEGTLAKICVEQGWNSEGDGVSAYIESLKDNGMFGPNPAMVHEWRQIAEGLKTGVQKTGGDRKRHEQFDEDYALLLLHQVGAFLSYVISRYENEYVE
ncbi:hypothetical protein OB920_13335 [Halobacteria archaeon HArc-gm2]|nr:hypothetical protein [Halobacteria archaeon HArc-gm2]